MEARRGIPCESELDPKPAPSSVCLDLSGPLMVHQLEGEMGGSVQSKAHLSGSCCTQQFEDLPYSRQKDVRSLPRAISAQFQGRKHWADSLHPLSQNGIHFLGAHT